VIDTSVLVAGLVRNHELHDLARPQVVAAAAAAVPGIVLAETWAALRRGPFNLGPDLVERALAPWAAADRILATPVTAYEHVLGRGRSLNLGGNVHDLLIALTCAAHGLPLATMDRRQADLARTLPDLDVTLLLADA
jgi:predicted nucleic acid-binding protein